MAEAEVLRLLEEYNHVDPLGQLKRDKELAAYICREDKYLRKLRLEECVDILLRIWYDLGSEQLYMLPLQGDRIEDDTPF